MMVSPLGGLGRLDDVALVAADATVLEHLQHRGHAVRVAGKLNDFLQVQSFSISLFTDLGAPKKYQANSEP